MPPVAFNPLRWDNIESSDADTKFIWRWNVKMAGLEPAILDIYSTLSIKNLASHIRTSNSIYRQSPDEIIKTISIKSLHYYEKNPSLGRLKN